jgi:hypothetical protein
VLSTTYLTYPTTITFTETTLGDYVVPCFAEGTRLRTPRGDVAVEALAPGDLVATAEGGVAPVRWIGRREVACDALARPAEAWPVRVRRNAFAPGVPGEDLFLSPDHAVFVEGVLVPVRYLENGRSIARMPREQVTYLHVELPRHALLLAEGLAVESYLDTGNRADFAACGHGSARGERRARQARKVWAEQACAPLEVSGPRVAAARARLAARAAALGWAPAADHGLRLRAEGREYRPVRDGAVWRFRLDAPVRGARLVSDVAVPAVAIAGSDDPRCLGVAVARLVADGHEIPLGHRMLRRGWHEQEPAWRWTAGAAELPLVQELSVVLAAGAPAGEASRTA